MCYKLSIRKMKNSININEENDSDFKSNIEKSIIKTENLKENPFAFDISPSFNKNPNYMNANSNINKIMPYQFSQFESPCMVNYNEMNISPSNYKETYNNPYENNENMYNGYNTNMNINKNASFYSGNTPISNPDLIFMNKHFSNFGTSPILLYPQQIHNYQHPLSMNMNMKNFNLHNSINMQNSIKQEYNNVNNPPMYNFSGSYINGHIPFTYQSNNNNYNQPNTSDIFPSNNYKNLIKILYLKIRITHM